jgi:MFS transporter, DHA2 family, multidrug resistance protein
LIRRGARVTSSVTLTPAAVGRSAINPWFVATAVVVPTFMEILDTTIATASLRYLAGGLSATTNDSECVMTAGGVDGRLFVNEIS